MTVLITGGGKGIGFACAELFLKKGYKVIITGRDEKRLISAKEKLKGETVYILWDIEKIKSAKSVIEEAHKKYGEINVFVNNAGIVADDDMGESYVDFFGKSEEDWDKTMNINLKGTFFALQAEAKYMYENKIKGNIINICSEMAFRPAAYAYGISKWGIRALTQGAGRELAPFGIVVNAVAPGETATEILKQKEGDVKKIHSPRGVQSTPEEIAESVYFLSQSRNIIGEVLISDGGRRLL